MLQFYFLSVLLNVVTGLVLVYATDFSAGQTSKIKIDVDEDDIPLEIEGESEENEKIKSFVSGMFLDDMTFRFVLGCLTGLAGLMKLLSTIQDDIPIVGDLIPAIAGVAGCFCLLLEYFKVKSSLNLSLPAVIEDFFISGRKYIGVFCIIAGLLHFIFPRVLFL